MGDELGDLKRLEEQFAKAMQEMYAVGNALAATRHRLETEQAAAAAPHLHGPAPAAMASPAAAPSPVVPPPAAATMPGAAPAVPPIPAVPSQAAPPVPPPIPTPPVATAAVGTAAGHPASAPGEPARAYIPDPTAYAPPSAPLEPPVPLWEREGFVTRLLGITGAVVTLSGLVMLLVLAVQQNWFGPIPRVVAGWVLAIGLIVIAHLVRAREVRAGRAGHAAVAIAATGYAAAYLCVIAMTAIYGWLPPAIGLLLAAIVAATGLLVARRWDSQILAVIIVLGAALLAPFVADGASWVLSAFVVVLAIATWPAQIGRAWPVLTGARMIPATLIVIPSALASQGQVHEPWAHFGVSVVLALAGLVMAAIDARRDPHPEVASMTVAVSALPLLVSAGLLPAPWHTVAYAVAASCWLALAGVGEATKKLASHVTIPALVAGTLAVLLAILVRDEPRWTGSLLLVAAAAYLVVAGATRSRLATWSGLAMTTIALLLYLRHPFTVLVERTALRADMTVVVVDSLLTVITVLALAWLTVRSVTLTQTQRRWARSAAWFVGLSVATTGVVAAGVLIGKQLGTPPAGFRAGHALATILWMATAVWLLGIGLRRAKDAKLSIWIGLALAAISVGKLFLYDLSVLSGIWRVIAFIVVGLMLLGAGTGYAKALDRARDAAAGPEGPSEGPHLAPTDGAATTATPAQPGPGGHPVTGAATPLAEAAPPAPPVPPVPPIPPIPPAQGS